jgi:hypothetical protein
MLHLGDSLAEVDIRKQAVGSPGAKGLSYPVEGGPAAARPGALVVAYRGLMVRLGERLELWGAGMQDRYLAEQRPDPCVG